MPRCAERVAEYHGAEQAAKVAGGVHDGGCVPPQLPPRFRHMAHAEGNIRSITPKQRVDSSYHGNQAMHQPQYNQQHSGDGEQVLVTQRYAVTIP